MYKLFNLYKLETKFICKNIYFKNHFNKNLSFKHILKLKIYIQKSGCNGFKYNFINYNYLNKSNILFIKNLYINIDAISFLFIIGSKINFNIFKAKKFYIENNNILSNCNCGASFNIK